MGNHEPVYRSSWEMVMMMRFDNDDRILKWASESIAIPYKNPVTGKMSRYIPDFFIVYKNKYGKTLAEVIEVKPRKETVMESKSSSRDRAVIIINRAKWAACMQYCKNHGFGFRVLTEQDIFKK